jgi:DNA-binding transcriptional ArsR family regulator
LSQVPPEERLPTLAYHADESPEIFNMLKEVKDRQAWNNGELDQLKGYIHKMGMSVKKEMLVNYMDWWSHPEEFGEAYLSALQAYQAVFFAEEERRIKPHLEQALTRAQELSTKLEFSDLFVELSRGVKITTIEGADEVRFVPSYWTTPLVMFDCVIEKHWVVLFGARPTDMSLVPGEVVPDAMLLALKALSDPTRLKILRYLSDEPQTPSQLAKKLRLRAPTVIHHLSALRLAGLVYVSMDENEEKRYTVRQPAVKDAFEALHKFLLINGDKVE